MNKPKVYNVSDVTNVVWDGKYITIYSEAYILEEFSQKLTIEQKELKALIETLTMISKEIE